MMEEKEGLIIDAINNWIMAATVEYEEKGCNSLFYIKAIATIRGMITALELATGKEYGYNEDGVYEIKEAEV